MIFPAPKIRAHDILAAFILVLTAVCPAQTGWDSVGTILARIRPPAIPDTAVAITDFGAVGNGTSDCTNAINTAIRQLSAAGGGKVIVPAGTFLTGAIKLKSRINLYIAKGATLLFTTDKQKYLPVVFTRFEGIECMNYSPFIYAYGETDIAITGGGTLDGQASSTNWWNWKSLYLQDTSALYTMARNGTPVEQRIFGNGHYLRPSFIQFYKCSNILVDSITIKRSPMWEVHPVLSSNVTVRNISVTTNGVNNDGCNPECSNDVLIRGCTFDTGDDCIAIKSGRNEDGRRVNTPSQNIVIQKCLMKAGHGAITLGSECSGSIRNVFADSCTVQSTTLYSLLRIKTNSLRGGTIENIYVRNSSETQSTLGSVNIDMYYQEGDAGSFTPIVRNIFLHNVTSGKSPYPLYIRDYSRSPVTNLQLKDCIFSNVSGNSILGNVSGLVMSNVRVNGTLVGTMFESPAARAELLSLQQNYPNPFNPATTIRFTVKQRSAVSITVYDVLGTAIARLPAGSMSVGDHSFSWNGMNSAGVLVPAGVYVYTVQAGNITISKKMIFAK